MTRKPLDRVLLKLSGEAFAERGGASGVDPEIVQRVAREIAELKASDGTEVGVVVGGGNMVRGAAFAERGMDRSTADHMGMLGTVINALALQDAIERAGVETRVQTAISLCMDNDLPIVVFEMLREGNIRRVVRGENVGTLVAARGR